MRVRVLGVVAVGVIASWFAVWPGVALGKYSGGTGEPNDPYLIGDVNDLHALAADANDYDKCFQLIADIDLNPNLPNRQVYTTAVIAPDASSSWGFQGTMFSGSFDGNGKKIIHLKTNTGGGENDYLGLFGWIDGPAAQVKNLGVEGALITGGIHSDYLGGLCGWNSDGTISNCYSSGQVAGSTDSSYMGSLCGYNDKGTISDCYSEAEVTGSWGSWYFGSLCGYNDGGTISNCYSSGMVAGGDRSSRFGGLCGCNSEGMILNSYSCGEVTGGIGCDYVGGLCGLNSGGTISNCYVTAQVTGGSASWFLGDVCGYNSYGTISNCYASGQVASGINSDYIGGLCGVNSYGTVSNCYFYLLSGPDNQLGTALEAGQMMERESFYGFDFAGCPDDGTEEHWSITGGHCPRLSWETGDGPLPPSYAPDTTLLGSGHAGDPFQINSAADFAEFVANDELSCGYYVLTCDIDLSAQIFTTAVISRCFGGNMDGGGHKISNATIATFGASRDCLGMFGRVCGSIRNLGIEDVSITGGPDSGYQGALFGRNSGTVSNCYGAGRVTGGNWYLGGLGGYSSGAIRNCYSSCQVICGVSSYWVGGLCGENGKIGTISNCYSSGSVSGGSQDIGGFCGRNYGTVTGCFWDRETSGMNDGVGNMQPDPNGVQGKITDEMNAPETFTSAGWDYVNEEVKGKMDIWYQPEGSYPKLFWEAMPGDGNYDGAVDIHDLAELSSWWLVQQSDLPEDERVLCDFNLDDITNLQDFSGLANNWFKNND